MGIADEDLVVAMLVAIVVIIILACAFGRVSGASVAGYWASSGGALYSLNDEGGRRFTVTSSTSTTGDTTTAGAATWVRGLTVASSPPKTGHLDIGGRRIVWNDGDSWYRQGV